MISSYIEELKYVTSFTDIPRVCQYVYIFVHVCVCVYVDDTDTWQCMYPVS